MKNFHFRLHTLLRLRKQQEDQKKRIVGDLVSEINEYQRQALEMAQAIKNEGQILRHYLQNEVDVDWIAHYHRYVSVLQQCIAQKIENVSQVQQKLSLARQELAEAARQTKILEKLREKLKARHDQEVKKMESREIDEIGTNVYLRSRTSA
ncbi:MAG: flagellar export protein FliJ [Sedimentisphaerales bacterium]|nr:flagellar export protein FliJ [Sedimentisphaerales bacterium]